MKKILIIFPFFILACSLPTTLPVSKVPQKPILVSLSPSPTPASIGQVIGTVMIRDYPENAGRPSHVIGWLESGDQVTKLECLTVGKSVWIRHATGWSVVRNGAGVYITGVCE